MFLLRQSKTFNLPETMMVHFYTALTESVLSSSVTIWQAVATAKDKGRLQRVIQSAEKGDWQQPVSLRDPEACR